MKTVDELLAWATAQDIEHNESRTLLARTLAKNKSWLIAYRESPVSATDSANFRALCARRIEGEPLAYIVGEREFWSLPLHVDRRVLIPRIETETLVDAALKRMSALKAPRIADLGTGSGAIIIALGSERPDARLTATDLSRDALEIAQRNAQRHGIPVDWRQGSWCAPLRNEMFDLIASNPPYIEPDDHHLLAGDLPYEPGQALVAQRQGLDAFERIIHCAPNHLDAGGTLILEHGATQRKPVTDLLIRAGFQDIQVLDDDFGNPRVVSARRA